MLPLARLMRANALHFRIFLWLLLAPLWICPTSAGAAKPASSSGRAAETEYQKIADRYHSLDENPSSGRKREEWLDMLQEAQQICRKHPNSRIAASCLHLTGRMHRSMYQRFKQPADLNQAVFLFRKLASQFPQSSEAAEALYAIAQIEQTNGNLKSAAKIYYDIVRDYPFSSRKAQAEKQLRQLKVIAESLSARKERKSSGQRKPPQAPPKPSTPAGLARSAAEQKEAAAGSAMPSRQGASSERKEPSTTAAALKFSLADLKSSAAEKNGSLEQKAKPAEPKPSRLKTPAAANGQAEQPKPSLPTPSASLPKPAFSKPAGQPVPLPKASVPKTGIFAAEKNGSLEQKAKPAEPKPSWLKTPAAANGQAEQPKLSLPAPSASLPNSAFSKPAGHVAPLADNAGAKQQKMILPVPTAPPRPAPKEAATDPNGNESGLKKIAVSALKVVALESTGTAEERKTAPLGASSVGSRQAEPLAKTEAASAAATTEQDGSKPAASTVLPESSKEPESKTDSASELAKTAEERKTAPLGASSVGSRQDEPLARIEAESAAEATEQDGSKPAASTALPEAKTAAPKAADASSPVDMLPVQLWSSDNYSRVAIGASGPAEYKAMPAGKDGSCPERFHVDFKQSRIAPANRLPVHFEKGLVKRIKADQLDAATVRVSLDMKPDVDCKVFSLNDPFRVVVDVRAATESSSPALAMAKPATEVKVEEAAAKEAKKPKPAISPQSLSLAQQLGLGIRRIVVDPGHGGKDSGATGFGLQEKQIALDVAKKVQEIFQKEHDYEVLLTREDDTFLALEERTAIANTKGADMFLSIHVNAHPKSSVKGVETFYLNLATNPEAMRVAALENATSTRSMSEMQDILSSLMKNTKINESSQLASFIQTSMIDGLRKYRIKDLGVKQAPFYVLIGAEMPAVLAEISYLSNKEEANLLKDEQYLKTIAEQIAAGVISYIEHRRTAALNL